MKASAVEGGSSDDLSFYMAQISAVALANQSPQLRRSREIDQLQFIDKEQLAATARMIANVLARFTTSKWDGVLSEQHLPSNRTNLPSWAGLNTISDMKLKEEYARLLTSGFDTETSYVYETSDGRSCAITERRKWFVAPDLYNSWEWVSGTHGGRYLLVEKLHDPIRAYYVIGNYYGEIRGDVTSEEAWGIIKAVHARLFGSDMLTR